MVVPEPAPCAGGSDAFRGAKDKADVQERCGGHHHPLVLAALCPLPAPSNLMVLVWVD